MQVTSILLLVATGSISFDGTLPAWLVPFVVKWAAILAAVNSSILTAMSGYSSPSQGPLISMPAANSSANVTVLKILIAAFALSLVFAQKPAHALTSSTATAKKCLIPYDPMQLCGALTGNATTDVQRVAARIKGIAKADLVYAIAKAKAANTYASGVRLQCIQAISDANDQANGVGLKNAYGSDMIRWIRLWSLRSRTWPS